MMRNICLGLFFTAFSFNATAQLTINNTTVTPADLVQNVLVGTGVTVSNIKFNGSTAAALVPQIQTGEFSGTSSIGISNGVIMATGNATVAIGPNGSGSMSAGGPFPAATDPDLNAISSASIYDQAVIEFDFVPAGDSIKFNYSFGSEEYLEFVAAGYNDAFGFFLSGPGISGPYSGGAINIATVPGTSTPVTIDNVNDVVNPTYYVNNEIPPGATIQYDGYTVVMTAKAKVQCGETYHIKLAICDAGDGGWDSGVFLQAGSFSSDAVEVNLITTSGNSNITEGCAQGGTFSFTRPTTSGTLTVPVTIAGNATNGVDYSPAIPASITFLPGEDSVGISFTAVADGIPEGVDSLIITIVNVNECGDTIVSTATLYIHDPMPLQVDLGPDLVLGCTGGNLVLNPNPVGGYAPYTYSWSNGSAAPTQSYTVTSNDQIIVTVDGLCGTTDTDTLNITIVPPSAPNWTGPVFSSYCPNDTLTIAAQYVSGGSAPFAYSWAAGGTDSTLIVSPDDTTTFSVTITDFCGLSTTVSVTVNVRNPSPMDVQINDQTLCREMDGTVVVSAVLTGGNGNVEYTWYQNTPGTITPMPGGSILLSQGGNGGMFVVPAIDECYIISTDTANIVIDDCKPEIPNIITPNGDGINDYLIIKNLDRHPGTRLTIFNRWGQEVYNTADYKNDWQGQNVNDGVFFYIVVLTDGSEPSAYSGFVHVSGKN